MVIVALCVLSLMMMWSCWLFGFHLLSWAMLMSSVVFGTILCLTNSLYILAIFPVMCISGVVLYVAIRNALDDDEVYYE